MTLLQEIQNDAVDAKAEIASLLRRCRILAARLRNEDFKLWVQRELDGYPKDTALPEYRVLRTQSCGHFFGPFGSGVKNAPLPLSCIPEKLREMVSTVEFREGVSALQNLVSSKGSGRLQQQWSADLVAMVASNFYENMNLAQAWKVISPSTIVGILDTVRNRILNFVLEIESQAPNAGESSTLSSPLTAEKVTNIFNTYITGNVGNIATGSSHVTQDATVVSAGDWDSLKKYLQNMGLEESDLSDLKKALDDDPKPQSSSSFGEKVSAWIGGMVAKSLKGIWKVGSAVGAGLLTRAIAGFYGLP